MISGAGQSDTTEIGKKDDANKRKQQANAKINEPKEQQHEKVKASLIEIKKLNLLHGLSYEFTMTVKN